MEIKYGINNGLVESLNNLPYISRDNISLILGDNRRTLDYRLLSLTKENKIIPLKRGLYLSLPYYNSTNQRTNLVEYISSILVQPSYISLEYALSQYGLIPESIFSITSVTIKKTKIFTTSIGTFKYRNIKKELYNNFKPKLFMGKSYYMATPAKALFDLLYLTPFADNYSMKDFLISGARINWDAFQKNDRSSFKNITLSANSIKMNSIVNVLEKENIL